MSSLPSKVVVMARKFLSQLLDKHSFHSFITAFCHRTSKSNALAITIITIFCAFHLGIHQASAQVTGIVKPLDPNNNHLDQQSVISLNAGSGGQRPDLEAVTTGNGISYNGGPVMTGPHNVYLIWYGSWFGNTATAILPDLIRGFNSSSYFNTNTTYGDNNSDIPNIVSLSGEVFDNYSQGSVLAGNQLGVRTVVGTALQFGVLPVDSNGIYLVLTSPDVLEGNFCSIYCGYHNHGSFNGIDIKYGFIGNPTFQCPSTCSEGVSPNNNLGADAMASVIAHELNETVTDPDLNAWFHNDASGEVGDLCVKKFGTFFLTSNGSLANIVLGGRNFLIQENWVNDSGGFCAMGFSQRTRTSLNFVPVTPCRIADTRNPNGPFGGPSVSGGTSRGFTVPNSACNIPATAQAYSMNATVVPKGPLGFLTMFPCGQAPPLVSTLNSTDGRVKAGAAIVPAGTGGAVCAFVSNDTDLVLDINGYFVPAGTPSSLAFFPLAPCRMVDTRLAPGPLGGPSLVASSVRTFPLLSSTCNVPAMAQAYSLNYTSVPKGSLGFLTTWPAGQTQPLVSTLNAPTGVVTANAAIVPAGTNGDVSVFVTNNSDLVVDINGYFAPPGIGGLSFHTLSPCRVLDTRTLGIPPILGGVSINVPFSGCASPPIAQSYLLNATVVPQGPLGFLTLWPDSLSQPLVSSLNAVDGTVTSNLSIVPTLNTAIDAFVSNPTHLVLDISGYFAP